MKYFALAMFIFSNLVSSEPLSQDYLTIASYNFKPQWEKYYATIFSDGTTVLALDNDSFGIHSYKIDNTSDSYLEVLNVLDQFQFNSFSDSYGLSSKDKQCKTIMTDSKVSSLSFSYAGKEKSVVYYHGCEGFNREAELKELFIRLKTILGLADYVGI